MKRHRTKNPSERLNEKNVKFFNGHGGCEQWNNNTSTARQPNRISIHNNTWELNNYFACDAEKWTAFSMAFFDSIHVLNYRQYRFWFGNVSHKVPHANAIESYRHIGRCHFFVESNFDRRSGPKFRLWIAPKMEKSVQRLIDFAKCKNSCGNARAHIQLFWWRRNYSFANF